MRCCSRIEELAYDGIHGHVPSFVQYEGEGSGVKEDIRRDVVIATRSHL